MQIPYERLSQEVLRGIVEEYITREGTDYGLRAYTLEEKVEQVYRALKSGDAKIVFDPETETCSIVASRCF
jgi:uncharacterized protein